MYHSITKHEPNASINRKDSYSGTDTVVKALTPSDRAAVRATAEILQTIVDGKVKVKSPANMPFRDVSPVLDGLARAYG